MTNYEKFMCKSVDELAEYIYKNDHNFLDEVCRKSLPCPHGDNVEEYNCINCVKVFLESEVECPMNAEDKLKVLRALECLAGTLDEEFCDCKNCSFLGEEGCDVVEIAKSAIGLLCYANTEKEKYKQIAEDFKKVASQHIEKAEEIACLLSEVTDLRTAIFECFVSLLNEASGNGLTQVQEFAWYLDSYLKQFTDKENILPGTMMTVLELKLLKDSICNPEFNEVCDKATKLLLAQETKNVLLTSEALSLRGEVAYLKQQLLIKEKKYDTRIKNCN